MSTKLERLWLFQYKIPQACFFGHACLLHIAFEIPTDLFYFVVSVTIISKAEFSFSWQTVTGYNKQFKK